MDVAAAAAPFAEHVALGVGEPRHGLAAAGVDSEHVHDRSLYWPACWAPLDYAVIAAYLAAITAFGSWFARYQHTTRDYFLSGHSVPWWAVCCTVVATETSTLTFIGIPATAYAGN